MLASATAPPADAVAQHGVPGDAPADPALVDAAADRGDRTGPLVAQAYRKARVAIAEVLHLPGEELDVGPAQADPLHGDHDLPGGGDRRRHLLN
jgi:hypothetical protein